MKNWNPILMLALFIAVTFAAAGLGAFAHVLGIHGHAAPRPSDAQQAISLVSQFRLKTLIDLHLHLSLEQARRAFAALADPATEGNIDVMLFCNREQ